MTITWYGQSCFRLEAKEGSVLIDPFDKEIGLKPPRIKDDIVLVSHQHYDHNAIDEANPEAFIIKNPVNMKIMESQFEGFNLFMTTKKGPSGD